MWDGSIQNDNVQKALDSHRVGDMVLVNDGQEVLVAGAAAVVVVVTVVDEERE